MSSAGKILILIMLMIMCKNINKTIFIVVNSMYVFNWYCSTLAKFDQDEGS